MANVTSNPKCVIPWRKWVIVRSCGMIHKFCERPKPSVSRKYPSSDTNLIGPTQQGGHSSTRDHLHWIVSRIYSLKWERRPWTDVRLILMIVSRLTLKNADWTTRNDLLLIGNDWFMWSYLYVNIEKWFPLEVILLQIRFTYWNFSYLYWYKW